jgi:hypothetical protein
VAAGAGALLALQRDPVPQPAPAYTIAVPPPPVPAAFAPPPAPAVEPPAASIEAPAEPAVVEPLPDPPEVTAAPEANEPVADAAQVAEGEAGAPVAEAPRDPVLAAVPRLVLVLDGVAWNPSLADLAMQALPPEVGFVLPADHPEAATRLGAWRMHGRDVLLAGDNGGTDALLDAHPGASGVLVDAGLVHRRLEGEGELEVRRLDPALLDAAGFTAGLREVTERARLEPPPIVVIDLYPGIVPQLVAWLDQLAKGGYRLVRASRLQETRR